MYEAFFHLNSRPFPSTPRVDRYFPAEPIEDAYRTLTRCIDRAEGTGIIIGGTGTGKTLLCEMLATRFRESFHIVRLDSASLCTRRALLQNILFGLNLPYRQMDEGELRLSLIDFLEPSEASRDGMLLTVDEAHTLPLRLVEEIRMITNLVRDGQPRVRLVMAGTSALEERLANPKLESLNQRVAARCYLHPLSYDETLDYVRSQITAVGREPDQLFLDGALQAVHHAAGGIPRLINQVCDHALILAAVAQRHQLDAGLIEEAWADLQQLPMPEPRGTQSQETGDTVVEFGSLDDPNVHAERDRQDERADGEPVTTDRQQGTDAGAVPTASNASVDDELELNDDFAADRSASEGSEDDATLRDEAAAVAEPASENEPLDPDTDVVYEDNDRESNAGERTEGSETDEPVKSNTEIDLSSQLSSIDRRISSIESFDAAMSCEQASEQAKVESSESIAQNAAVPSDLAPADESADPFAERFEWEETVADPYSALEAQAQTQARAQAGLPPSGHDGDLNTAFEKTFESAEPDEPQAAECALPEPVPTESGEQVPIEDRWQEAERILDLALEREGPGDASTGESAPIAAEPDTETDGAVVEAEAVDEPSGEPDVVRASVMRSMPPDDSDLIVVVDEQLESEPLDKTSPRTHRREYRDLFTRLREN